MMNMNPNTIAGADPNSVDASLAAADSAVGAALLDGLELPVEVRLGRLVWSLGRVLELRVGDAVPVGPDGDDAVTLYVQGKPYATGDLVVVDGRFAFRVRELALNPAEVR